MDGRVEGKFGNSGARNTRRPDGTIWPLGGHLPQALFISGNREAADALDPAEKLPVVHQLGGEPGLRHGLGPAEGFGDREEGGFEVHAATMRYLSRMVNGKHTASGYRDLAGKVPHMTDLISQRIEARLAALGLSARAASLQAGLAADGVRNILRGKSTSPRGQTLVRLAEVLQCSLEYLLGADGDAADGPDLPATGTISDMKLRRLIATRLAFWRSAMKAAEALNVSLSDLHAIETADQPLDDAFIMKFAAVTGAPLDWLILGKITDAMKPEMAARIALFDPALVSEALEGAQTPEGVRGKPRPKQDN